MAPRSFILPDIPNPNSVIKDTIPTLIEDTKSKATNLKDTHSTVVNKIESIATAAQSAVPSLVDSAKDTAESIIGQIVPLNISIGSQYLCAAQQCWELPPNTSTLEMILPKEIPGVTNIIQTAERIPNFENLLIAGLVLSLISLTSMIISLKVARFKYATILLSIITWVIFLALTILVITIAKAINGLKVIPGVSTEYGELYSNGIVNLVMSSVWVILSGIYLLF